MSRLEVWRLPQGGTISQLIQCDKRSLGRGMWRDHPHQAPVVRLILDMMADIRMDDLPLWAAVLRRIKQNGYVRTPCLSPPILRKLNLLTTIWYQVTKYYDHSLH